MNSTFYYLVEPLGGKDFASENNDGIILSANIEDHRMTNRLGKVIGLPGDGGEIQLGDIVLVHHNTFRSYYDFKGKLQKSANHVIHNIYYVEKERIYAYYRDSQENVFADYCFVEPIKRDEGGFQYSTRAEKELVGKVALVGQGAIEQGIAIGDTVAFKPDSEYEFRINDVRHYRIPIKNIYAVL
jgi:hypothetical protein